MGSALRSLGAYHNVFSIWGLIDELANLDRIDVHIVNQPGRPFLGSGETGQGPAAASIANAVANATGKRFRDLPLTHKRIKDATTG